MDGAVGGRDGFFWFARICWAVTEEEMAAGPAACTRRAEIGGVAVDMEHHATGVVVDNGFWVRCTIIQEFDNRCGFFLCGMFLLRGNSVECHEHGW
eukprot:11801961-Ditylum_brightwellii.AAC.1